VVEGAGQPGMPRANSHIADIATREWPHFFGELQDATCLLLHLSEGLGPTARQHFLHLKGPEEKWAILEALAGIHCGGLEIEDFAVLAQNKGTMVWSPLSNLLLYGGTANVKSAKEHGVTIALGPDWSPTGSKNVLGELKVAKLVSESQDALFSDREVVAMATRNPAKILKWSTAVGSLEAGKRADVLVVRGAKDDPYASLIAASESHVDLVLIDGLPRFGSTKLMRALGSDGEHVTISGNLKLANLGGGQPSVVKTLPISDAKSVLSKALHDLPKANGAPPPKPAARAASDEPVWYLALDEEAADAARSSASSPYAAGDLAFPGEFAAAAPPLPFVPLELDPISMADDGKFLDTIGLQPNLPDFVKRGLPRFF
jgi:5-methylthioadenosine/S-adenosylhomocysteine deaminase